MTERTALQNGASYVGLVSSCLSIVLGIVHVCNVKARIHWPKDGAKIIDDVQRDSWRSPLFTFQPDLFFDVWTPFFFGLFGVMAHISNFQLARRVARDYVHYFVFLAVQALFANIGYDGGFGILVAGVTFLGSALALVCAILDRQIPADLQLQLGVKFERPARA